MTIDLAGPHPAERIAFTKGHGTENDFVLIADPDNQLELTAEQVAVICDRRAGIGADGVLRVVRGSKTTDWAGDPDVWFMDYRNADGSIAEMCGNGVRVFVRFLLDRGLADGDRIPVGTRAGLRQTEVLTDGRVRVAMGPSTVLGQDVSVEPFRGPALPAYRVDVGNPHAVAFVSDASALAALDLSRAPHWSPTTAYPAGVNVEFVHRISASRIAIRVFERGSGETRSCGTGTCAAVAATVAAQHSTLPVTVRVDVPGGAVEVELSADQTYLTGPSVLVADGVFTLDRAGAVSAPAGVAAHPSVVGSS